MFVIAEKIGEIEIDNINKGLKMKQNGFSLVELSIVLIIVGVISIAVYVGADLIQNAKENTIIADFQKYKLYTDQFKEKYEGYPGDLIDATTYFGAANTNNGDGDKVINPIDDEQYLAWQHLAFAGYIEGPFTGNNTSETIQPAIGFDVPESPIATTPYLYSSFYIEGYNQDLGTNFLSNFILLANLIYDPSNSGYLKLGQLAGAVLPNSAYNIDLKADDGIPTTGLIYGFGDSVTDILPDGDCFTDDGIANSKYKRNIETKSCYLLYDLK